MPESVPASTFGPVREAFRALAVTIVPEARRLDAAGWDDLERIVEEGLASRPGAIRTQRPCQQGPERRLLVA